MTPPTQKADPPGFDPARDVWLEPRMLRGLAHPLRIKLRGALIEHGPATASQLAERIGESSGSTSYHLRQLAEYGFVMDVPEMGDGRERYWRAAHRSTWFDMPRDDAAAQALGAEYLRAVALLYAERIVRFAESTESTEAEIGREWADAATMSDWLLDLDLAEVTALRQQVYELCAAHRGDEDRPAPGKRRVVVQFQLFPTDEATP